jgi:hypothetical protein
MRNVTHRWAAGREMGAGGGWQPAGRLRLVLCTCAIVGAALAGPSAAEEKPAEIIAAHIRTQGYACENALSALRDRKASKPNEMVWTLRCSNGIYRVRLVPDMAAHVELMKPDKSN